MNYGTELILDLHNCDASLFTKKDLIVFFERLAALTGMELQTRYWWTMDECPEEWKNLSHLNGISCVQFISTSNFTIHALFDGRLYLNIFTCKDFDPVKATEFTEQYFKGDIVKATVLSRK